MNCLQVPCVVARFTVGALGHYHVGQCVEEQVLRIDAVMLAHAWERVLGPIADSVFFQEGDTANSPKMVLLPRAVTWLRSHGCPHGYGLNACTSFRRLADNKRGIQGTLTQDSLHDGIAEAFRFGARNGLPEIPSGWKRLEISPKDLRSLSNQWHRAESDKIREILDHYDGGRQKAA